jgi:ADP-glucose type glycogen/starch synthase
MKILFAIAEAYPFVKVGGLADVGGALPKALARLGHETRLILPGYRSGTHLGAGRPVRVLTVPMGPNEEKVEIRHHGKHGGVEVYTVRNGRYFDEEMIYGGYEHGDVVPFILFSKAVTQFAADPDWCPDIVHCNDWHTGLVPTYARGGPDRTAFARTGFVFSIHNLAYQGNLDAEAETLTDAQGGLEADLEPTLLARGILSADVVNTVSRNYLAEILTPEHGMGMDDILRARSKTDDLYGVLNGVDYEEFDPRTDPHLIARYDDESVVAGKKRNKAALQEKSGLAVDPNTPLLGMVARLADQKGIDLVCEVLDALVEQGVQVVVTGRGAKLYHLALEGAARTMEGVAYHPGGEEALARLIYAGSDLSLTPSRFEPCGLVPMISLRYGTIPVVRKTGGLVETVTDYSEDKRRGLGFAFAEMDPRDLVEAAARAVEVYGREEEWRVLQRRAMAAEFSWGSSARRYEELYSRAVAPSKGRPDIRDIRENGSVPRKESRPRRKARILEDQAVPLAVVHHANQYLITDGYEDREGISQIVEGYARILRLHEKYAVPAGLHLSGTLIEAIAWHCPWFLKLVRALKERGVIFLVCGTYSENIMPLFSADYNRRQLEEAFWLYERHLGVEAGELEVCWVPERVWDTDKIAPVLADETLPNGGYRHVLLDDRLLFPTNGNYPDSPRARFDAAMPYRGPGAETDLAEACKPCGILGSGGLTMTPISSALRYRIPPSSVRDLRRVEGMVASLRGDEPGSILVYADDLERTAGVGGWERSALGRYEVFVRWLASRKDVQAVRLPAWFADHPPREQREIEPGAFYELERGWEAGEDYRGWLDGAGYAPSKEHLEEALRAVEEAEREGADRRLLGLARRHLLASGFETAWHEPGDGGLVAPAGWAKAIASHARASRVVADAAKWFAA